MKKILLTLVSLSILAGITGTTNAGGGCNPAVANCPTYNTTPTPSTPQIIYKPVTLNLYLDGKNVNSTPFHRVNDGTNHTFKWNSTNAKFCFMHRQDLKSYNKKVALSGSISFKVVHNGISGGSHGFYVYCLGHATPDNFDPNKAGSNYYLYNGNGYSRSINVFPQLKRPVLSVNTNKTSITKGQSVMISWNSQNTTSCKLNGTSVGLNGQKTVTPQISTYYRLQCTNKNQHFTTKQFPLISVQQPMPIYPWISKLQSSKTQVTIGSSVNISWNSIRSQSCTLNGMNVGISGTQTLKINNSQWIKLICKSSTNNSTVRNVYVSVKKSYTQPVHTTPITPSTSSTTHINSTLGHPKVTFKISNVFVKKGTSATLSWTSTGASSCKINGVAVAKNGSKIVTPTKVTTYKLSCVNSKGQTGATGYTYVHAHVIK